MCGLSEESNSRQIMEWNLEEILLCKAPIIASTPRVLLQMLSVCCDNKRFSSIFSNLNDFPLRGAFSKPILTPSGSL